MGGGQRGDVGRRTARGNERPGVRLTIRACDIGEMPTDCQPVGHINPRPELFLLLADFS
jgi:hypothetical protein